MPIWAGQLCGVAWAGLLTSEVASRPDHILMSNAFFRLAVKHISDHCTLSLRFLVEEAGLLAGWSLNAGHR